jgi:hypothetical protein
MALGVAPSPVLLRLLEHLRVHVGEVRCEGHLVPTPYLEGVTTAKP